jgi:hypothetical protein
LKELAELYSRLDTVAFRPPHESYWVNLLPRIRARLEKRSRRMVPRWIPRYALPLTAAAALVAVFVTVFSPRSPDATVGAPVGTYKVELRSMLNQMDSSDLSELEQQSSLIALADRKKENGSGADSYVIKSLIGDSKVLYSAFDVNVQSSIEGLEDTEMDAILDRLNQTTFFN